jgi:signal transduction histidine kinase
MRKNKNDRNLNSSNYFKEIFNFYPNFIENANSTTDPSVFIQKMLNLLLKYSNSERIDFVVLFNNQYSFYQIINENKKQTFKIENNIEEIIKYYKQKYLQTIIKILLNNINKYTSDNITANGSIWLPVDKKNLNLYDKNNKKKTIKISVNNKKLLTIPIWDNKKISGFVLFKNPKKILFKEPVISSFENMTALIFFALKNINIHSSLIERAKELTCLYQLYQLMNLPSTNIEKILKKSAGIIPLAWQYPEITFCEIQFKRKKYKNFDYNNNMQFQKAEILAFNKKIGTITVGYTKKKTLLDEGPFLKEERNLLNVIAKQLGLFIERKININEKIELKKQLFHADRLATLGQLSAGIAHELNEPLASILGFAQLAKRENGILLQTKKDLEKIEAATLYGREIIKKLMFFAKQLPPQTLYVNLNYIIDEVLFFLETQCTRKAIILKKYLAKDLPDIIADSSQIKQIIVNLIINSIQVIPNGGTIEIKTFFDKKNVYLSIKDSGIGIKKENLKKIFLPFFTTKNVNEGTGLGLSVVHGIVSSHGGTIKVKSKPNEGTIFTITFPLNKSNKKE